MGLTAAWRRQGAWATAVTLLVPGALFLALLGGGFRAIGALGQVVTGPQVPATRVAAPSVRIRRHVARLPTGPALRPVQGILGAGPGPAGAPATRGGAAPAPPVATVPPRRAATRPAAGSPAPAPPPQPAAPPAKPSSPVRQAGEQVAAQVGQAPVAGPAGQQAITGVLDAIVPPRVLQGP